jgi:N-acetylneuraminic acid mutarotase
MICALVAFISASDALAQKGTWTTIAPMPIGVSFGANGVVLGKKIYVIDGTNGISQAPQLYDPLADKWTVKAKDPVLRSESSAGVINNKIYVAEGWGGQFGSDSNSPTSALEIYDPVTDSWTAGASSLIARGLSATAVIDGKLYIAGGTAAQYVNFDNLEIYDSVTNTWSLGASLPAQLTSAAGVALNGKFYVLGGYVGPSAFNNTITAAVQIYDPVLNTWSMGTPLPAPRANMVVGVIKGKLCVASGTTAESIGDPSVQIYNPITDKWNAAADEPTPRAKPAAAVVGNMLFVAGGNTDGGPSTSAAEVFTPPPPSATDAPMF